MAYIRGCFGKVYAGPTPTEVGEVRSFEFEENAEEIDVSVMGDCTVRTAAGPTKTTGRIVAFWNQSTGSTTPAPDAGQELLNVGDVVAIEMRPNGDGAGKPKLTASVSIQSVSARADVGNVIELTIGWSAQGGLTRAAQA